MMGFGMGGFGLLFLLIILLIVGLAVVLISLLFPRQTAPGSSGLPSNSTEEDLPLDIIRKRYARGEISKAEFEEMRSEITGGVS